MTSKFGMMESLAWRPPPNERAIFLTRAIVVRTANNNIFMSLLTSSLRTKRPSAVSFIHRVNLPTPPSSSPLISDSKNGAVSNAHSVFDRFLSFLQQNHYHINTERFRDYIAYDNFSPEDFVELQQIISSRKTGGAAFRY